MAEFDSFAGNNTIEWNGRDARGRKLASGVYFYGIRLGERSESRKLLLLK